MVDGRETLLPGLTVDKYTLTHDLAGLKVIVGVVKELSDRYYKPQVGVENEELVEDMLGLFQQKNVLELLNHTRKQFNISYADYKDMLQQDFNVRSLEDPQWDSIIKNMSSAATNSTSSSSSNINSGKSNSKSKLLPVTLSDHNTVNAATVSTVTPALLSAETSGGDRGANDAQSVRDARGGEYYVMLMEHDPYLQQLASPQYLHVAPTEIAVKEEAELKKRLLKQRVHPFRNTPYEHYISTAPKKKKKKKQSRPFTAPVAHMQLNLSKVHAQQQQQQQQQHTSTSVSGSRTGSRPQTPGSSSKLTPRTVLHRGTSTIGWHHSGRLSKQHRQNRARGAAPRHWSGPNGRSQTSRINMAKRHYTSPWKISDISGAFYYTPDSSQFSHLSDTTRSWQFETDK
jgi:hypothetical protein